MPLTHDMLLASNRQETYPYIIAYRRKNFSGLNQLESYYYEPTTNQLFQTDIYYGSNVAGGYPENTMVSTAVSTFVSEQNTSSEFYIGLTAPSGNTRLKGIGVTKQGLFYSAGGDQYASNSNYNMSSMDYDDYDGDGTKKVKFANTTHIFEKKFELGYLWANANTVYTRSTTSVESFYMYVSGGGKVVVTNDPADGDIKICSHSVGAWSELYSNTSLGIPIYYVHPYAYYGDAYLLSGGSLVHLDLNNGNIVKTLFTGVSLDYMDYRSGVDGSSNNFFYMGSGTTIYIAKQLSSNDHMFMIGGSTTIPLGSIVGLKLFGGTGTNTHLLVISSYNNVLVYGCNTAGYLSLKKDYNAGGSFGGEVGMLLSDEMLIRKAT